MNAPPPARPTGTLQVSLAIRTPDWTISYATATRNSTAFQVLEEASLVLGFELDYVQYGWPYDDIFVTSINGTRNDGTANLWWQYCVNDEYAAKGAATQGIRDGDVLRWVYAAPGGSDLCR